MQFLDILSKFDSVKNDLEKSALLLYYCRGKATAMLDYSNTEVVEKDIMSLYKLCGIEDSIYSSSVSWGILSYLSSTYSEIPFAEDSLYDDSDVEFLSSILDVSKYDFIETTGDFLRSFLLENNMSLGENYD